LVLGKSNPWMKPAFRVGAAALGSFLAGPLGSATGAILGKAIGDVFGESAARLIDTFTEKFGEDVSDKVLGSQLDALAAKAKASEREQLEQVYREAFRESLIAIHSVVGRQFEDWFENWDACLKSVEPLDLEVVQPGVLFAQSAEQLLGQTMQRLDAQGAGLRKKSLAITEGGDYRAVPAELLSQIDTSLPEHFTLSFRALIVSDEYKEAWKEAELAFRDAQTALLARIAETTDKIDRKTDVLPQVSEDTSAMRRMIEEMYNTARRQGRIPQQEVKGKDEEIASLTAELRKLQEQLAARAAEPEEAKFSALLDSGDLDGALLLKSQQVEDRREEAAKLPRDLYELGILHELRFEWPQALDKFREAWERGKDIEHGFKYAHFAQKLNHFEEAIGMYEALLKMDLERESRASTLNNLAIVYRDTQRMQKAESLYKEALGMKREVAEGNPELYLPQVATSLNNLGNFYRDTQHMLEAEEAFLEALTIYKELAESQASNILPDVAVALNNLAILYGATQRVQEAEEAYSDALIIRRELAETEPEVYLPYVATTLNNLGILYSDSQRMQEAEEAYAEALAIRRKLAETNPEAYLPAVAGTLNNLAVLHGSTGRTDTARTYSTEATEILGPLWQANPELHGNQIARNLLTSALVSKTAGRPANESLPFACRALDAAYDLALRQTIEEPIEELHPGSQS
jgi:tetratricopeptide (TPR) repeat protein